MPSPAEQLTARGILVVTGQVAGWEDGGVRMVTGELVPRQALVVGAPVRARADVLVSLGLRTTQLQIGGHDVGSYVACDPTGLTAAPGVWVAGNVADPRAQVITSAAAGLWAGGAVNADLVAEGTRHAVERARVFGEAAWEARYRAREDGIWSGNPTPSWSRRPPTWRLDQRSTWAAARASTRCG